MKKEAPADWKTAGSEHPDWWSYGHEFPRWHVWRGIAGLLYAPAHVEPASGGPRPHPAELRDLIRETELQLADRWK